MHGLKGTIDFVKVLRRNLFIAGVDLRVPDLIRGMLLLIKLVQIKRGHCYCVGTLRGLWSSSRMGNLYAETCNEEVLRVVWAQVQKKL